MTLNHTNESAAFSLEAKQAKTSGEQYTPLGVLSVLAQLGESQHGGLCDPCCGTGWIVSAEMLNRAHTAG
jgi:type I restriction-modification system DNA methylase subunit